jgi:hypothetical protein
MTARSENHPTTGSGDDPMRQSVAYIDRERWKRVEPLLDRALDLPDEVRGPWLAVLRLEAPDLAEDVTALILADAIAARDGFLVHRIGVR